MDEQSAYEEQEDEIDYPAETFDSLPESSFTPAGKSLRSNMLSATLRKPISGRYEGEMTAPTGGRDLLDLRVDIDVRYRNSRVMNRLSGDFYQVNRLNLPGSPPRVWRVYRESWIVNSPQVTWSQNTVEITGAVRFWKSLHPPTGIKVRIPFGAGIPTGPAEVIFNVPGGVPVSFSCIKKSNCFRTLKLEVDACESVNAIQLLPVYDTSSHPNRPVDLPRRTLTLEKTYREAGVCLSIRPQHTVIDDSAPDFISWSEAELHDAMETHFSRIGGQWPRWEMWGILAGQYDDEGVGGIMFDAAADFGGAGVGPERQGFAVFRNHSWFSDLPTGAPVNQAQADAVRKFLYTWVHEAGHAFNFLHSWDKNRPDSLSWMNYDWRYDNRNGADRFWSNFRFTFDDEELIHLRHGDRSSVIMGGDPWASGGHIEGPSGAEHHEAPPGAMSNVEGDVPIELLLRSKEFFEFMEPVFVEFRLRNLFTDLPLNLDINLNPEYGGTVVYIRRPDGRIVEFAPIMCKLAKDKIITFQPARGEENQGDDRYSENVFLSYGRYGFYFDEPGEYLVRALYQGPGDVLIPSNIHRLRIGSPLTKEVDRLAQDFFTYQVGVSLYLNGSQSPYLSKGMGVLEEVAARYQDSVLGAKAATAVANSVAQPFFSIRDQKLIKIHEQKPQEALALTEPALKVYKEEKTRSLNLTYHNLVRQRVACLTKIGNNDEARSELATLRKDLKARGANEPVLNRIQAFEQTIPAESGARTRTTAKKPASKKSNK